MMVPSSPFGGLEGTIMPTPPFDGVDGRTVPPTRFDVPVYCIYKAVNESLRWKSPVESKLH